MVFSSYTTPKLQRIILSYMARTKNTSMNMRKTSSPYQASCMIRSSSCESMTPSIDLNQEGIASSQGSNEEDFHPDEYYQLDYHCPHCMNNLYLIGEHVCNDTYLIKYHQEQTGDLFSLPPGITTPQNWLFRSQYMTTPYTPNPPLVGYEENVEPTDNLPSVEANYTTPPTKTSSELYSEYSKKPQSNVKLLHLRRMVKRNLSSVYDNIVEETIIAPDTPRISKRVKKTPTRYVEIV